MHVSKLIVIIIEIQENFSFCLDPVTLNHALTKEIEKGLWHHYML